MNIQLIRHATLVVTMQSKKILVDPMLSDKGANSPIQNSSNDRRNPLVSLPFPVENFLPVVDAVLITHTHRDHFDEKAAKLLPKHLPVFCQPQDEEKLRAHFANVYPVHDKHVWKDLVFIRTDGQHGTGEIGKAMSPVSGFVLQAQGEPSLYIAGDTIWCEEVAQVLHAHQPDITVVNAGAAQFVTGDPITMTVEDVMAVCEYALKTQVVAVHMEAINHCLLARDHLKEALAGAGWLERVRIPRDGESMVF